MTTPDPYSAGYDPVEMCAYGECRQPADHCVERYWWDDLTFEERFERDDNCPAIWRAHRAPYIRQNHVATVRASPEPYVEVTGVRCIPLHTPNPQPTVRRQHW